MGLAYYMHDVKSRLSQIGWIQLMHKNPLYNRKSRCIMNLLLNTYQLGKKRCALCNDPCKDMINHILFSCTSDEDVCQSRSALWGNVLHASPGVLGGELSCMDNLRRTQMLLNAFNCEYICEWQGLYEEVCNFIYGVYNCYYNKVNM